MTVLKEGAAAENADEAWLVSVDTVRQPARKIAASSEGRLFCYTLDSLIDEQVDFTSYFSWLENEVQRRGISAHYVPLAATKDDEGKGITSSAASRIRFGRENGWLEGYLDGWLSDPGKEHISILGEFGTGKTWFALHYAWTLAQRYLKAKANGTRRPRLPIVVFLREFSKSVNVESLMCDFLFRAHTIKLPTYTAFEQLNRMGKFLLIFDGFDEMAARVDRDKTISNFWELARIVVLGSKVILTSRTEHFPSAQESRDLLRAKFHNPRSMITGQAPQFEVLQVEPLSDEQVRAMLNHRTDPATTARIMGHPDLLDLSRRPVMIDLILEALPDLQSRDVIDLARVYLYALRRKMERDIRAERTFTSMADKLYFLCELSWEMLATDRMSLNYREFPIRIRKLFGAAVEEQKELDHWHYDMMGQTILVRNADGDYTPGHRSFLEFFVAYKTTAMVGLLHSDFLSFFQPGSKPTVRARRAYTWSEYFHPPKPKTGQRGANPKLARFAAEPLDRERGSIDFAVAQLIGEMVDPTLLPSLQDNTAGSAAGVSRLLSELNTRLGMAEDAGSVDVVEMVMRLLLKRFEASVVAVHLAFQGAIAVGWQVPESSRPNDPYSRRPVSTTGQGITGRVFSTAETHVVTNIREHPDGAFESSYLESSIQSIVAVPLRVNAQTIGVVELGTVDHRRFDEKHIGIVESWSDVLCLCIAACTGFKEVWERTPIDRRYRLVPSLLSESTRALTAPDFDEIVKFFANEEHYRTQSWE